jgi:cell division protein FtsW (lipid II flippase)
MKKDEAPPQINVSKIQGDGGIAGALFAISSLLIFLYGIPMLRYFLPAAIILGLGVALMIKLVRHFIRPQTPGTPWILATLEEPQKSPGEPSAPPHHPAELVILPA